jgi:putative transposase
LPIYHKPDTSRPAKGHKTSPYLRGGLRVERPNRAWCGDITYLPMRKGFLSLVAIMDWFTRKVLAWRISSTLEAEFCLAALNEAIHKFGPPGIMNTDQVSQFTSCAWTDRLKRVGARISMDGKRRCLDNPPMAFTRTNGVRALGMSRWWRSLKYGRWIIFYNHQRPHAAHGGQPPAMVSLNHTETDQQVKKEA